MSKRVVLSRIDVKDMRLTVIDQRDRGTDKKNQVKDIKKKDAFCGYYNG